MARYCVEKEVDLFADVDLFGDTDEYNFIGTVSVVLVETPCTRDYPGDCEVTIDYAKKDIEVFRNGDNIGTLMIHDKEMDELFYSLVYSEYEDIDSSDMDEC